MLDFRPNLDNDVLIWIANRYLPFYLKFRLSDTKVQPAPGAIEKFKSYAGKRALVCPNHSNRHDPQVMFEFSRLAGESFNYVAAREVFDYDNGINGWWLQRLGCYSVVRGAADRESFKTTKRILSEGKKKLVLFPEGEISRQNDTLMPLESGAAQLTFWAVEELAKQANGAEIAPIYVIPMAIKYTFPHDIRANLVRCMSELEEKMAIKTEEASLYIRLRNLALKLLDVLEHEYSLKTAPDATMQDRIVALRQYILTNLGRQLQIEVSPNVRQLESVRILRNKVDDFIYTHDHDKKSDYEKSVHEERAATFKGYYADLDRAVNFIAIYDGYLKEKLSQERFADILDRLEREVMRSREPSQRGARIVHVDVGEPIDLSARYAEFKKDKKGTIAKVTEEIFSQISVMLVKLEQSREPIMVE
jgi:1-acyl-sn-glycerol-3-phosphate acyltransferase